MRHYWTRQAVDCYKRGCVCEGCLMHEVLSSGCIMKKSVLDLVREYGAPPENEFLLNGITEYENRIIEAIINGCETKHEICEYLELKEHNVQSKLSKIYEVAETLGCKFKKPTNRLPELVEFIKEYFEDDTRDE